MDIRELDRLAVTYSVDVVRAVPDGAWTAPSPCAAWTVGELVAHMTVQHRGFAAAARGEDTDVTYWRPGPLGDRPATEYAEAAREVLDAFAGDGALGRTVLLPEITTRRRFPAEQAIRYHFLDYVVHTWDVAAAIGRPLGFDDGLVEAALEVAIQEVPAGSSRERPAASFGPVIETPAGSPAVDRLLAYLGRSPAWRP